MSWARQVAQCHTITGADGSVTIEPTMMYADNLDAQTYAGFIEAMEARRTSLFFYPAGETDVLAPLDAGFGKDVKHGVGVEMDAWLDHDENLERWYVLILQSVSCHVMFSSVLATGSPQKTALMLVTAVS
jgi:hypothetical protein